MPSRALYMLPSSLQNIVRLCGFIFALCVQEIKMRDYLEEGGEKRREEQIVYV